MNRRFNTKCSGVELSHLSARSTSAKCRVTMDSRPTRRADVSKFSVAKLSVIQFGAELRDIKAHLPRPRERALSFLSLPRSMKTTTAMAAFLSEP
uniref:Uncharacterized protein n=1 Tax=Oryza glumipatula TaxID=40148 RepID=A0A0E0A1F0_9ORYZ